MKITKLKFAGYKKFKEYNELEIRPVTIIVGKNSSGKSSVLKLMPMLRNALTGWYKSPILFENEGVTSGISFADLSHNGEMADLCLGAEFEDGTSIYANLSSLDGDLNVSIGKYEITYCGDQYVLSYDKESKKYNSLNRKEQYSASDFYGFVHYELFKDIHADKLLKELKFDVDYIGPFRCLPPRSIYFKGFCDMGHVGYDGGNAYNIICSSDNIESKVSSWFEDNFDETKVEVQKVKNERGTYHVVLKKKGYDQFPINIVDEGQGIGQILPVVIRCNMMDSNSYVMIEQPELHMHPAAHASIAKLFATTCKANNQTYIIETHSKNLLLGVQDMVVDRSIPLGKDDVVIYYVNEDEQGVSSLKKITINEEGELSYWPRGVFEEASAIYDDIERKVFENKEKS